MGAGQDTWKSTHDVGMKKSSEANVDFLLWVTNVKGHKARTLAVWNFESLHFVLSWPPLCLEEKAPLRQPSLQLPSNQPWLPGFLYFFLSVPQERWASEASATVWLGCSYCFGWVVTKSLRSGTNLGIVFYGKRRLSLNWTFSGPCDVPHVILFSGLKNVPCCHDWV